LHLKPPRHADPRGISIDTPNVPRCQARRSRTNGQFTIRNCIHGLPAPSLQLVNECLAPVRHGPTLPGRARRSPKTTWRASTWLIHVIPRSRLNECGAIDSSVGKLIACPLASPWPTSVVDPSRLAESVATPDPARPSSSNRVSACYCERIASPRLSSSRLGGGRNRAFDRRRPPAYRVCGNRRRVYGWSRRAVFLSAEPGSALSASRPQPLCAASYRDTGRVPECWRRRR
jgi:hypothetical protein